MSESEGGDVDTDASGSPRYERYGPSAGREFDWRGWLLVTAIVVSFVVIPAVLLGLQAGSVPIRAYVVLPLLPAIGLASVAVWAALAAYSEEPN